MFTYQRVLHQRHLTYTPDYRAECIRKEHATHNNVRMTRCISGRFETMTLCVRGRKVTHSGGDIWGGVALLEISGKWKLSECQHNNSFIFIQLPFVECPIATVIRPCFNAVTQAQQSCVVSVNSQIDFLRSSRATKDHGLGIASSFAVSEARSSALLRCTYDAGSLVVLSSRSTHSG
jgi:hypothetical protein